MAENYDLIFGQSASQQYAWSDSDYQNGWQTVGSTPPTAEQFDALQRRSDMKAKDLNDRLSPFETKAEADGRQAATAYAEGVMVTADGLPNGWLLECVVAGNSGAEAITLPSTLIDGLTIVDGDVTWKLRKVATNGGLGYRQPSTAYTAGQIAYHSALPTGYYLECTTAGITSAGDITPSSTIGGTVSDGTVTWKVRNNKDLPMVRQSVVSPYDANNYLDTGYYYCQKNSGTTFNNLPIDETGVLVTYRNYVTGGFASQMFNSIISGKSYIRCSENTNNPSNWKPWQQQEAIVAKSIGTNGYIKYASGLIVQWGRVPRNNLSASNPIATVIFPVSFTTTNHVFITPEGGSTIGAYSVNKIWGHNTTQFEVYSSPIENMQIQWFAIGY